MESEFWQSRWQQGRIGFHKSEVNPLLTRYFNELNLPTGSRVLVPLCGKSVDMVWLARQGYEVVGIELVESAVAEFFTEQNITPVIIQPTSNASIKLYRAQILGQTIELWVADIFALTTKEIGDIDAVYDRAALIALPEDVRFDYSEHISKISGNAPQLLITLNYDQSKKDGPPFSITEKQLQQYYSADHQMTNLESQSSTFNTTFKLPVTEQVWLLKP